MDTGALWEQALARIPGGVNSPVRAFTAVKMPPILAAHAKGAYLTDIQGRTFLDFLGAWGPLILGHADDDVVKAIQAAAERGTGYGLSTAAEVELAQIICAAMPSVEKVRLVNSGTEATMSAIRLARGFTQRTHIIKFEGCYHGHADPLLVKAGSGLATLSATQKPWSVVAPSSAGVLEAVSATTIVLPYNNLQVLADTLQSIGDQVAAVIIEPVAGNMGVVPPLANFLKGVRDCCSQAGALLIMDEVITGFRLAWGGAQAYYGVMADLTTLGKIIGGGLPIGAYGGRAEIMNHVAPLGDVYQSGTMSGNPITVAAGLATLKKLQQWRHVGSGKNAYDYLEALGGEFEDLLNPLLKKRPDITLQRVGSMFTLFFGRRPLRNWQEIKQTAKDTNNAFSRFYRGLMKAGILLPPSAFEAAFLSLAHTSEMMHKTAHAITAVLES